jgi:hypothetical protein
VRLNERARAPWFTSEPELDQAVYEDILRDFSAMATVFERMPLVSGTREEHLRNVILGMLEIWTGSPHIRRRSTCTPGPVLPGRNVSLERR